MNRDAWTANGNNQDQDTKQVLLSDMEQQGKQIAALAAIVPYIGTALYIALRPSLVVATEERKAWRKSHRHTVVVSTQ